MTDTCVIDGLFGLFRDASFFGINGGDLSYLRYYRTYMFSTIRGLKFIFNGLSLYLWFIMFFGVLYAYGIAIVYGTASGQGVTALASFGIIEVIYEDSFGGAHSLFRVYIFVAGGQSFLIGREGSCVATIRILMALVILISNGDDVARRYFKANYYSFGMLTYLLGLVRRIPRVATLLLMFGLNVQG